MARLEFGDTRKFDDGTSEVHFDETDFHLEPARNKNLRIAPVPSMKKMTQSGLTSV